MQKKINQCRICQSESLEIILKLPMMPFTDEFLKQEEIGKEFLGDIEIGICRNCGTVQNLKDTDMASYYNDYSYTVQLSNFAMQFMKNFATTITTKYLSDIYHILWGGGGGGGRGRRPPPPPDRQIMNF
jgi:hypothetical protein